MNKYPFLCLTALILFTANVLYAQNAKLDIGVGVGVLPTFLKDRGKTLTPPVSVSADLFLNKNVSLGLIVGASDTEARSTYGPDGSVLRWKNSYSWMGVRFLAHTDRVDRWDIYGGFTLGYGISRLAILEGKWDDLAAHKRLKPVSGDLALTALVGARRQIKGRWWAFGELGLGTSLLTAGVSWRLR
ncbi:MAG: hypothetical protein HUU34_15145 [Saprospiraceae bacterium]|jgi:hypothetical protein|nr:hypothetical protein [Saprospiraceae bacterium]